MKIIKLIMSTGDSLRIVAPPGGIIEFMADVRIATYEHRPLLVETFNDKAAIWRFAGVTDARDVTPIYIYPTQIAYHAALVEDMASLPVTDEIKKAVENPFEPSHPSWSRGQGFETRAMTREEMLAEMEKDSKKEDRE